MTHDRRRRYGDPVDRFWARVDKHGSVPAHRPDLGPCWPWTGRTNPKGYGIILVDGHTRSASSFALELKLGRPLAPGMESCHHCDNPPCVNGDHLFEGTHAQNLADMAAKGRAARNGQPGETNPSARLTPAQVGEIRALAGLRRQRAIAVLYGISQSQVSLIQSRQRWAA